MKSFLEYTAQSILEQMDWQELSNTTLVLPSHRAGIVLKEALLRLQEERHADVIWAPQVQTLPQLQDALSPLYSEDELMTIVRLYRHYRQLNASESDLMPLDLFYGWGRQMIADFTNVDASMPAEEVENFFANTIAAHELSQWKLDKDVEERLKALINPNEQNTAASDSIRKQYEHIWRQLYSLYQLLQSEMLAEQKGYAGMRQRAVIAHWDDEEIQQRIAGRTYIFVGFNYLLPVERDLMDLLRKAGKAYFYWDYIPDFKTNEKAFSFVKQNSELLGIQNTETRVQTDLPKRVTVVSCVSKEAQAQYVHRWLSENYTEREQKVGVVICDESMLEPVIYTLPAITLPGETEPAPVNITKGFPLRNTAIYARVLRWLSDPQRGASNVLISADFIDTMIGEVFRLEQEDTVSETESSEGLKWQELLILESEYQVRKIVNQLRLLVTNGLDGVPFTLKLFRLLIRRMMESVTMPFHGEPVTDIQVMGVLETRVLDFDKLLLLNVEEGVLPQRQADLSFIPYYLRKAYHMQTSDERATVYAYNFFRLLNRAGHSTILFSTAETSNGGKGMSRFIMQILVSGEFEVTKAHLVEHSVLEDGLQDPMTEFVSLESTLSVDAEGKVVRPNGRRYSLSPSALNTFISCPRSFYFQYILGLQQVEKEETQFAPNTLGSFVHHTMQYIYETYAECDSKKAKRVTAEQIEAIRTDSVKMQGALDAAYAVMNKEWLKDHPDEPNHYVQDHHIGENLQIMEYVNNILERDREDAKVGLQIYLLEQRRMFSVPVDGVGEILTGGIIDRLDIYGAPGHERLRVVDYKSGNYDESKREKKLCATWDELLTNKDKNYLVQTLIYSHAVKQNESLEYPIEPNLYFCKCPLTSLDTTVHVGEGPIHDYSTIETEFMQALQEKIKVVMTTTKFPQCEEDTCPPYCPFFSICGRKPKEFFN